MEEKRNENRSMMKESFNDNKADKSKELNSEMTIAPTSQDEYTKKLHNLKGGN